VFLGKISYTLYLVHFLFINTVVTALARHLVVDKGMDYVWAEIIVLIIFTPIILFVSWILAEYLDGPSKDFAFHLDLHLRVNEKESKSEKDE